jgi:hypothetical protein
MPSYRCDFCAALFICNATSSNDVEALQSHEDVDIFRYPLLDTKLLWPCLGRASCLSILAGMSDLTLINTVSQVFMETVFVGHDLASSGHLRLGQSDSDRPGCATASRSGALEVAARRESTDAAVQEQLPAFAGDIPRKPAFKIFAPMSVS